MTGQKEINMLFDGRKTKEKMCPLSYKDGNASACVGDKCAAFRWLGSPQILLNKTATVQLLGEKGMPLGYCGLVGEPEYQHIHLQARNSYIEKKGSYKVL